MVVFLVASGRTRNVISNRRGRPIRPIGDDVVFRRRRMRSPVRRKTRESSYIADAPTTLSITVHPGCQTGGSLLLLR